MRRRKGRRVAAGIAAVSLLALAAADDPDEAIPVHAMRQLAGAPRREPQLADSVRSLLEPLARSRSDVAGPSAADEGGDLSMAARFLDHPRDRP